MAGAALQTRRTIPRNDPKPRPTDGILRQGPTEMKLWTDLEDRDPGFHYVWAINGDGTLGFDDYCSKGYEPVTYRGKGFVRPVQGKYNDGDIITRRGHTLVQISLEALAEINAAGELESQRYENAIIDRNAGKDALRGVSSRYLRMSNETTELEDEGVY